MTATEAVDRIEAAGHPRPQDRRLHARGAVYEARFIPSGQVERFTVAEHFRKESSAVVRFSNGAPTPDADDRQPGVRGMAVKFLSDGHAVADLVAANFRVFPSRTPEGFIELVELLGSLSGGPSGLVKAVPQLARLLRKPESRRGIFAMARSTAPASFATTRYDGLNAFLLVDGTARRRPFRYRLLPELGEVALTKQRAATLPAQFLATELDERLTHGPVSFALALQFAEPSDRTDDPSTAWPEDRLLLPAGRILISRRHRDEAHWQRAVFDPSHTGNGVEVSDDPVLAFRPHAYSVSADRRLQATPDVSGQASTINHEGFQRWT